MTRLHGTASVLIKLSALGTLKPNYAKICTFSKKVGHVNIS